MSTRHEAAEIDRELKAHFESAAEELAGSRSTLKASFEELRITALRVKRERDELLALAKELADECAECDGTGLVSIKTWPGGIEVDNDDQPCLACVDIRRVIRKVEDA